MARTPRAAGVLPAPSFSRAFDRIVQDADDVVGLLAYALYKEAVREEVIQGASPNPADRNPPNAVVKIYREAAEQRLSVVINGGIAQATPDIEAAAIGNVVKASEILITTKLDGVTTRLEDHVNKRTGFLSSITTNLIAWLLSLAITIIILLLANRGGIQDAAVNGAQSLMDGKVTKAQPGNTTE